MDHRFLPHPRMRQMCQVCGMRESHPRHTVIHDFNPHPHQPIMCRDCGQSLAHGKHNPPNRRNPTMATIECIELRQEDYGNNTHKFYRAYIWNGPGLGWGVTHWGRMATTGQFQKLTADGARKKIHTKSREGYGVAISWTQVTIPDSLATTIRAATTLSTADARSLADTVNKHFGALRNVAPVGAGAPGKSPKEEEEEFKAQLLAMAGKLKAEDTPTTTAPASVSTPVDAAPDLSTMDGKLAAALEAAKTRPRGKQAADPAPTPTNDALTAALAKAKSR